MPDLEKKEMLEFLNKMEKVFNDRKDKWKQFNPNDELHTIFLNERIFNIVNADTNKLIECCILNNISKIVVLYAYLKPKTYWVNFKERKLVLI